MTEAPHAPIIRVGAVGVPHRFRTAAKGILVNYVLSEDDAQAVPAGSTATLVEPPLSPPTGHSRSVLHAAPVAVTTAPAVAPPAAAPASEPPAGSRVAQDDTVA